MMTQCARALVGDALVMPVFDQVIFTHGLVPTPDLV